MSIAAFGIRSWIKATVMLTAFASLALGTATGDEMQNRTLPLEVTCGNPMSDPDLSTSNTDGSSTQSLVPGRDPAYEGGHRKIRNIMQRHPESDVEIVMWMQSEDIGWWQMVSLRPHPDDLVGEPEEFRWIYESPLLPNPVIIPQDDDVANDATFEHLFAVLPNASLLRCAS